LGPTGEIVVVSGLPRSGTSMMMRMIEAGGIPALTDGVRAADTDNPHGYYEFEPVKETRRDPSWLDRAPGRVVKLVHVLLRDLPEGYRYRVVFMHRELDEVLASQAKMLARSGRRGAQLPVETLRKTFESQVAASLAWLASEPRFSVIQMRYREVVESPRVCAERLAAFLDLPAGAIEQMAGAVDPAMYRNRA